MPFVKLDCGILDSTLWIDRDAREAFVTALLMAVPVEFTEPMPELMVDTLDKTGFIVPPGWYGFVAAAGSGIVRRAGLDHQAGVEALRRLATPESDSRSSDYDGRRMVRVNGGYVILNYMKYRDKDTTAPERMRRLRQRRKENALHRNGVTVTRNTVTNVTIAEAEAEYRVQKKEDKEKPDKREPLRVTKPAQPSARFVEPTPAELEMHATKIGLPMSEVEKFVNYYRSKGWLVGHTKMRCWRSAMSGWRVRWEEHRGQQSTQQHQALQADLVAIKAIESAANQCM